MSRRRLIGDRCVGRLVSSRRFRSRVRFRTIQRHVPNTHRCVLHLIGVRPWNGNRYRGHFLTKRVTVTATGFERRFAVSVHSFVRLRIKVSFNISGPRRGSIGCVHRSIYRCYYLFQGQFYQVHVNVHQSHIQDQLHHPKVNRSHQKPRRKPQLSSVRECH